MCVCNTHTHSCTLAQKAGAFYPFFRAHAHLDTRRREPWLYEPHIMSPIRDAIRLRYQLLPFWYTTFHESSQTGLPILRPVWIEYPRDRNTYNMEEQFLVGDDLMVRPITQQNSQAVQIYLPGSQLVSVRVRVYADYEQKH